MVIHSFRVLNFMLPECTPNFACTTNKVERACYNEHFENNTGFIYLFFLALLPTAGYGLMWLCSPARAMASFTRFLDHTQRRATFGRNPLDE
jgi:hypothetical protein